ncbi:unnamed protein product [Urochloa humidicola]
MGIFPPSTSAATREEEEGGEEGRGGKKRGRRRSSATPPAPRPRCPAIECYADAALGFIDTKPSAPPSRMTTMPSAKRSTAS